MRRRTGFIAAGALGAAVVAAYAGTFAVPFHFDDFVAIANNPTLRDLGRLRDVLAPPYEVGATVGGRPVLNLSFAVNFAIGKESLWSYHAFNLAVHLAGAFLLFGIVRQAMWLLGRRDSPLTAWLTAAAWALHPLQTESVTYLSQRAESLAAGFYLATIYAFCRAVRGRQDMAKPAATRWLIVSALACMLGVATKEIVVTAPLLVLLMDRTFVSGSFAQAWRDRRAYYVALMLSWPLAAALVIGTHGRGGTAGIGIGVSSWQYLLTQSVAIVGYLKVAVWPAHQVFDHGTVLVRRLRDVWPQSVTVFALLVTSIVLLLRPRMRRNVAAGDSGAREAGGEMPPNAATATASRAAVVGFLGVAFFLLLAPSSSVVPVGSQTIAEHRMYLPLAALAILTVLAIESALGKRGWLILLAFLPAEGLSTWSRNAAYRTELSLWSDTVAAAPTNPRAHNNRGDALMELQRFGDAAQEYEAALALAPDYPDASSNLAHALVRLGRAADALPHAASAAKAKPHSAEVWTNYGLALSAVGRTDEAIEAFRHALAASPDALDAAYDLGNAYFHTGRYRMAATQYEHVLARSADRRDARYNLALALLRLNEPTQALTQLEAVLLLDDRDADAHVEAANILLALGRPGEAIPHLETALRLRPDFGVARDLLAKAMAGRRSP